MKEFKKIYELIENFNNNELSNVINSIHKFNPNIIKNNKSLLYISVYCNNFEAFLMLIHHKNFDKQLFLSYDISLQIILTRCSNNNSNEATKYLTELLNLNIKFNPLYIKFCTNYNFCLQILNYFDFDNILSILLILIRNNNKEITLYIFEYLLVNHIDKINQDIISKFLANHRADDVIFYSELFDLLIKYNIDISITDNIPSIIYFLHQKNIFDYFVNKKYYYNDNLLDNKYGLYLDLCLLKHTMKIVIYLICVFIIMFMIKIMI